MIRIRRNNNLPILQSLVQTVDQICEVLPSLEIRGDNRSTFVNQSAYGTTIRSSAPVAYSVRGGGDNPLESLDHYVKTDGAYLHINPGNVMIGTYQTRVPGAALAYDDLIGGSDTIWLYGKYDGGTSAWSFFYSNQSVPYSSYNVRYMLASIGIEANTIRVHYVTQLGGITDYSIYGA